MVDSQTLDINYFERKVLTGLIYRVHFRENKPSADNVVPGSNLLNNEYRSNPIKVGQRYIQMSMLCTSGPLLSYVLWCATKRTLITSIFCTCAYFMMWFYEFVTTRRRSKSSLKSDLRAMPVIRDEKRAGRHWHNVCVLSGDIGFSSRPVAHTDQSALWGHRGESSKVTFVTLSFTFLCPSSYNT